MMNDVPFYEYQGNGHRIPKDVKRVRFHPSVTKIDDEAFNNCKRLRQVVLNEGLQTIGKKAFYGCKSSQSITLPSTVTEIGLCAFQGCSVLREVVLNEGIVKINRKAFCWCTSLESITIPSSVTHVGHEAFSNCRGLNEVVLSEGLKKIEWRAFNECKSLERITLPSTVTEIRRSAFSNCNSLREVVLNDGLKTIGDSAFFECVSLESITIPSSVVKIGSWTFQGCSSLREVLCIEGLPNIEHDTFGGCNLERITFPNISTRLDNIIQAGRVDIQNKIQQYINRYEIEWERGGTIRIPVQVTRRRGDGWGLVQQHFRQIANWIKYYEIKEATTLFELALWKAKIDQKEDYIYERDRSKKAKMNQAGDINRRDDRNVYRVDVPGPVKDTILQYL